MENSKYLIIKQLEELKDELWKKYNMEKSDMEKLEEIEPVKNYIISKKLCDETINVIFNIYSEILKINEKTGN